MSKDPDSCHDHTDLQCCVKVETRWKNLCGPTKNHRNVYWTSIAVVVLFRVKYDLQSVAVKEWVCEKLYNSVTDRKTEKTNLFFSFCVAFQSGSIRPWIVQHAVLSGCYHSPRGLIDCMMYLQSRNTHTFMIWPRRNTLLRTPLYHHPYKDGCLILLVQELLSPCSDDVTESHDTEHLSHQGRKHSPSKMSKIKK